MLLSTSVATRLEPPTGRAAKRSRRRNYVSSRSFSHVSQRRLAVSNCALASSSVAAWPSVRMSAGLPKMRCSDQNQRMLSGPPGASGVVLPVLVDPGAEAGRAEL